MPRRIRTIDTFDEMEDDIRFTAAALAADPDAEDLVRTAAGWFEGLEEARGADRAARQQAADVDAARVIANGRLDAACASFAAELFFAAGNDRRSTRWTQFFSEAASTFVRQALARQVATVRGWLASGKDAALEKHRTGLDRWSAAADAALVKTRGLAATRGQVWQRREELAANLTRERDALRDLLAARARERGLPREWPDLFFRVDRGREEPGAPADDAPPPAPPAP